MTGVQTCALPIWVVPISPYDAWLLNRIVCRMWYMVVASTAEVTVDTGPEPEVAMIVVPFGW